MQTTVETKLKRAKAPNVTFKPQARKTTEMSVFSETGALMTEVENSDWASIDYAAKQLKIFLKEKDPTVAKDWSLKHIQEFIDKKLAEGGYDRTFLSKQNLLLLQQAFGPMFRGLNEENPRLTQRPKNVAKLDFSTMPRQTFSESAIKEHGTVYYTAGSEKGFSKDEANLWEQYLMIKKQAVGFGDANLSEEAKAINKRLEYVDVDKLKTPWNLHYASYEPERIFSRLLIENADQFESFVRMPDRGFYSFPYSFKPAHTARTHARNEQFNPDFFLRIKQSQDVLVVEIKGEEDRDVNRSAAKFRDGKRHFETLNEKLVEMGEPWRYHFYFLSPDDCTKFFESVKDGTFSDWKSGLMQELGKT